MLRVSSVFWIITRRNLSVSSRSDKDEINRKSAPSRLGVFQYQFLSIIMYSTRKKIVNDA